MDWNCFRMFKKEEEVKKPSVLKAILIVLGAITAIAAAALVVYRIFKKYFTITFECGDCDSCDEGCFDEDEEPGDPLCCCDGDEEAETEAPEAEN